MKNLNELQQRLGYTFNDENLLQTALTHRSYANEHPDCPEYNERLEFLGDAVLELAISQLIYSIRKEYDEGKLTRLRAAVVNENRLAELATGLQLGNWLMLGKGEESGGGRQKDSLLANTLEAVIGAVFVDSNFVTAADLVNRLIDESIVNLELDELDVDYKTRLQEMIQARFNEKPKYEVISESGPDHAKRFLIEVSAAGRPLGRGEAGNKKRAQQRAARRAVAQLDEEEQG